MSDVKSSSKQLPVPDAPPSFADATGIAAGPAITSTATAATPDPTAQPPIFRTRFACVTLNSTDKIRFISFPKEDVSAIRTLIARTWPRGEQSFGPYGNSWEVKLNGNPWSTPSVFSMSTRADARRLTRTLLSGLYDRGWVLQAGIDACKKSSDKDSLVFRHQFPPPPACEWLSIAFDRGDRLTISDAPPAEICKAIKQVFGPGQVQRAETTREHFELKFSGYPWRPSGTDTVKTRLLLLALFEALERFGYSLYASIDQDKEDEVENADVLVFARQKGWVPGMPVFHR